MAVYKLDGLFVLLTAEDLKNSLCLHEVGARFVDTRDLNGRETFLPLILSHHLFPSDAHIPGWYLRYRDNDVKTVRFRFLYSEVLNGMVGYDKVW